MTERPPFSPLLPMARRLARLDPATRACPARASAALRPRHRTEDIEAGLAEAMLIAGRLAALAASDRPWALMLGHARDVVAAAVLAGVGAWAWAVLA